MSKHKIREPIQIYDISASPAFTLEEIEFMKEVLEQVTQFGQFESKNQDDQKLIKSIEEKLKKPHIKN